MNHALRPQIVTGATAIGKRLGMSASTVYRRKDDLPIWQNGDHTSPLQAYAADLDQYRRGRQLMAIVTGEGQS